MVLDLLFAVLVGIIIGLSLKKEKHPPVVDTLTNQVEILEEKVAYYKDLCKWHVEEKTKLQQIKDKFERECG